MVVYKNICNLIDYYRVICLAAFAIWNCKINCSGKILEDAATEQSNYDIYRVDNKIKGEWFQWYKGILETFPKT